MWEAPPLPYYCDASALPAPLPSTSDIHNATCTLSEGAARVVRVGHHFVVKYGPQTSRLIQEGINMIFIHQNLKTPLPSVYALYQEGNVVYLLMQHVTGQRLDHLWPELQANERAIILTNLRNIFNEMRSLPPPTSPFYGNVCRGPLPYFLFWTPEAQKSINGPFTTEEELYLALVQRLRQIHTDNNQHSARVDWFQKHLSASLTGHPPTFTHGDVQRKNVIVTQTSLQNGDEDNFKLVLIDWEDSGWYPSYFEYFSCYTSFTWDDEWPEMVEWFLDPCPVETLLLLPIYHEVFM